MEHAPISSSAGECCATATTPLLKGASASASSGAHHSTPHRHLLSTPMAP
uniref:Uncharacterized protein n=1 Tax=Arundo donax TaxID=35708 RepID=A0A0A9G8W8_ARUDO